MFEDRRKESRCSALELTRWLLPPPNVNLPKGMCQFIGRKVEIIKRQSILKGIVESVLPPCQWMVVFEDGTKTKCYAQELLLWMQPVAADVLCEAESGNGHTGEVGYLTPRVSATAEEVNDHVTPLTNSTPGADAFIEVGGAEQNEVVRERLRVINSNNISGDLDCCEVRQSTIPGAGLGLFATKVIYPKQRITKYSGKIISHTEAENSDSAYILHVNSRVCLDAEGEGHMVGRYTNEGEISGKVNNARFGASQKYYWCKMSDRPYVPIIAKRKILPGEEIFSSYGKDVRWKNLVQAHGDEPNNDDHGRKGGEENEENKEERDGKSESKDTSRDARNDSGKDKSSDSDCDDSKDEDWTPSSDNLAAPMEKQSPLVHEVMDQAWTEINQAIPQGENADEMRQDPKAYAGKWYDRLCKTVLEAADKVLPRKRTQKAPERHTSERTKKLMAKRSRMNRRNSSRADFRRIQKRIKESCLQDYVEWVDNCVGEMEKANDYGDVRKIYNLVNKLSQKPKPPPSNLTKNEQGDLLKSPQAVVDRWERFLKCKFQATEAEAVRPDPEPPPNTKSEEYTLKRSEFEAAIKRLKSAKAVGPDEIPIEVYKKCPQLKEELFKFIKFVWDSETVPENLGVAKFVMLYKHKGSSDDPTKYRCIGLLNHGYKILAQIILARLLTCTDSFLKDWQAGFRAKRGCRDNAMILRTICQRMMDLGKDIAITFVDYTAAFDTVSHKFLDKALKEAGAPAKVRAMFRAVYKSATAFTTTTGAGGEEINSKKFPIRRGVLQGDVTSPLYFILALELILRIFDAREDKGISFMDIMLHTLGYADDVAILEEGDAAGINRLSERITEISKGSKDAADMSVSIPKTMTLHVRKQDEVSKTTSEEAKKLCRYECPHLNCDHSFLTKKGMLIHAARCEWKDEFEIERIVSHRGPVTSRSYLVKWKGYTDNDNSWVTRTNLHPKTIEEYEKGAGVYVYDWRFRCPQCDLPCASERGVRIHMGRAHKEAKQQEFHGRLVDKAVQVQKMEEQQLARPQVMCEGQPLCNVFRFRYLGTIFAANASQKFDLDSRIAMAMARCGRLRPVFDSKVITLRLKLRLYEAAVCSLMTYGCETWDINVETQKRINGANSVMLARITGKSIPQEARPATTSLNLIRRIRMRRHRWVGHILRLGQKSIVYQALKVQSLMMVEGNLLMDVPPFNNFEDLARQAMDRARWRELTHAII